MNIKLLKDLNFAGKINNAEAVTEAGKEMLKNYRAYCYSNAVNCGIVNGFIAEAQNFRFDTGLVSVLESVLNFIGENKISWKLATACESISNNPSTYNYISKLGIEQVQKLLEMNENEVISYIKAGSLKSIQYIPEFRSICKEVYKTTVNEAQGVNFVATCPVSYVMVQEGKQYFNVYGKTFAISEGKVSEATCEDRTFNRVNALLESFTKVEDNIEYQYNGTHGNTCKFTINENNLSLTNGLNVNESFDNVTSFREYCDMVSRTLPINEKMNWMNVTSAIAEVFEAIDNIVILDHTKTIQTSNGTIAAIIEANDNVNLTVFRSINAGTSCTNYDFVIEALNQVNKISGVDLKVLYENRIDEDLKREDPEEYKQIKEELAANKQAQIDIRKKKIAMLAEKYKNDPARIALLNRTAKELALLEGMK